MLRRFLYLLMLIVAVSSLQLPQEIHDLYWSVPEPSTVYRVGFIDQSELSKVGETSGMKPEASKRHSLINCDDENRKNHFRIANEKSGSALLFKPSNYGTNNCLLNSAQQRKNPFKNHQKNIVPIKPQQFQPNFPTNQLAYAPIHQCEEPQHRIPPPTYNIQDAQKEVCKKIRPVHHRKKAEKKFKNCKSKNRNKNFRPNNGPKISKNCINNRSRANENNAPDNPNLIDSVESRTGNDFSNITDRTAENSKQPISSPENPRPSAEDEWPARTSDSTDIPHEDETYYNIPSRNEENSINLNNESGQTETTTSFNALYDDIELETVPEIAYDIENVDDDDDATVNSNEISTTEREAELSTTQNLSELNDKNVSTDQAESEAQFCEYVVRPKRRHLTKTKIPIPKRQRKFISHMEPIAYETMQAAPNWPNTPLKPPLSHNRQESKNKRFIQSRVLHPRTQSRNFVRKLTAKPSSSTTSTTSSPATTTTTTTTTTPLPQFVGSAIGDSFPRIQTQPTFPQKTQNFFNFNLRNPKKKSQTDLRSLFSVNNFSADDPCNEDNNDDDDTNMNEGRLGQRGGPQWYASHENGLDNNGNGNYPFESEFHGIPNECIDSSDQSNQHQLENDKYLQLAQIVTPATSNSQLSDFCT